MNCWFEGKADESSRGTVEHLKKWAFQEKFRNRTSHGFFGDQIKHDLDLDSITDRR